MSASLSYKVTAIGTEGVLARALGLCSVRRHRRFVAASLSLALLTMTAVSDAENKVVSRGRKTFITRHLAAVRTKNRKLARPFAGWVFCRNRQAVMGVVALYKKAELAYARKDLQIRTTRVKAVPLAKAVARGRDDISHCGHLAA